MGLVMASYVTSIILFLHVVDVTCMLSMCLLYVSLGSRVSPSIFGVMCIESVMLSICSGSCVLYSAGSGVNRVYVVLSGLGWRFCFVSGLYLFSSYLFSLVTGMSFPPGISSCVTCCPIISSSDENVKARSAMSPSYL